MNGIEIENFYNLDDKRYILKENKEFIRWFSLFSVDYEPIISIDDMQNLIDEITLFYEIKYPDKMLFDINHGLQEKTKDTIKISKLLNFEQLKYRLHGDYVQFLKCSYQQIITLKKEIRNINDLNTIFIRVDSFGKINELDIKSLKHYNFLRNIDNLKYIEDLYGRFEASDTRVDYSNLATAIKRHRKNIILRNRILELIPYSMIYSENTLPIYGYIRSKSFIRTFNKELDINLELDNVHKIMNKDYSKVKKIK